jgi:hypothetical protein
LAPASPETPYLPFDLRVVRLHLGVGHGPIGEVRAGDRALLTALDEIDLVKAPVVRGEVHRAATNQTSILQDALFRRDIVGRCAVGVGLRVPVVRERRHRGDRELVVLEVGCAKVRPLFEHDDTKASLRHSRAITPPAAPAPTMTKSTSSFGAYVTPACWSRSVLRMYDLVPIVVAERLLPEITIIESDQLPSDLVAVPSVLGIREHAGRSCREHCGKEFRLGALERL